MIDLRTDRSDVLSQEMREAMGKARNGDADVLHLQDISADLLGKDAALFVPSATMANEIAINVQTTPGDVVIADRFSHISEKEGGSPALVSGVNLHLIDADRGVFTEEDVLAEVRPDDPLSSQVRLVVVENAHNLRGGTIWPLGKLMAMSDISERLGIAIHMDGSHLMNAVVGSGISAREFAYHTDTASICFYKGLGVPFGAILAGSKELMKEARRVLRQLGGHMEGAGIFAAGAIYALTNNVERLAEDHGNAKVLAERLSEERALDVNPDLVETNIVTFGVQRVGMTAPSFAESLAEEGVRCSYFRGRVRAVTHAGISRRDVLHAADAVHRMLLDIRLAA